MLTLTAADFVSACYPVPLVVGEIQLWFVPSSARSRAHPEVPWLRPLLAAYVGHSAAELRLARGEHGKPYLAAPPTLEFNLSHTRGGALVGISRQQVLGVDIETRQRSRPVIELARRYFAEAEAVALSRVAAAHRQDAFLRLWSCKEAVVKALGRGIGFGLARVAFALDSAGTPMHLNVIDASAGAVAEWQIVGLAPTPEHVGALAWRGPARPVRAFALQLSDARVHRSG
jgi:4'-phosphopantetheinyl transferase